MNKINNKIPWGADYKYAGYNNCRCIQRYDNIRIGKLNWGALALVTALLARQQMEKKKIKPELAVKLK
jgi:hypothetical protein